MGNQQQVMPKKLTQDEVYKQITSKNTNLIPVSSYTNTKNKITVFCKVCLSNSDVIVQSLLRNDSRRAGCPICSGKKPKNTESFKEDIKNILGNEYEVIGEYINSNTPIKILHKVCGFEFENVPHRITGKQRQKCSNCFKTKKTEFSKFIENIKLINPYIIFSEEGYNGKFFNKR
jgi:hypothetical protein